MRLAAATLLALLLALTACGQLDPPEQRLAEAPQRTEAAETARMALESTANMGDPNGSSMNYTITGDGQIDFADEQLQLTFDMPGPMPGNMEMVVDGDVAYLNMPFASSAGDDETRWIKTEVDEAATDQMMQSGMSQDPADVLTALGAVEGGITELGNEEVGGEPTHGYAFDVSADEISPLDGEQAEKLSEVAVAMEAWLDTEGRVRRLSQTVDLAEMMVAMDIDSELPDETGASLEGITGEQTTVIEFFGFGEPVNIEIPSADQVDEQDDFEESFMEELASGSASSSGSDSAPSSAPQGLDVEERVELEVPAPDAQPAPDVQDGEVHGGPSAEPGSAPKPTEREAPEADAVEPE